MAGTFLCIGLSFVVVAVIGKERYVMHAVDIIHDFYVKKDGKYKVFVENRYKKKIKIGIAICVEK